MEQQTKQEEMQQEQKKTSFLSDMAEVLETVFCFNICRDPAVRICDSSGNR